MRASVRRRRSRESAAAHRILTRCKNAAYNMLMEGVQDFIDNPGHRCVSGPEGDSERVQQSMCAIRGSVRPTPCAASVRRMLPDLRRGRTHFSGKRDLVRPMR